MAILNTVWYVRDNSNNNSAGGGTVGWSAVAQWGASTAYAVGNIVRQVNNPTSGNERCFVCIVAGTSGGSQPSWTLTKGAKTTDNTVTWMECTGMPATNGDSTNTPAWAASNAVSLGQIIYDSSTTSYQIVTTAGTTKAAPAPSFSGTAGTTTADNTATWTSLGAASGFSAWGAPHARLRLVFGTNWAAAADTIYIGSDHAESQSSAMTVAAKGTFTAPNFFYSMDAAASFPLSASHISAGAALATSGASALGLSGTFYCYGITFSSGSSSNAASFVIGSGATAVGLFEKCNIILNNSSASSTISAGSSTSIGEVRLLDCSFKFGAVGQYFNLAVVGSRFLLEKCQTFLLSGSSVPTTLFVNNANGVSVSAVGCDFSDFGSGKTLFGLAFTHANANCVNCKFGSSVTVSTTPTFFSSVTNIINSDSANTTYQSQLYSVQGTLVPETTIVRTGGATDGVTPSSWKITTTSSSLFVHPFKSFPIAIWNSTTGTSVTVTVYGIWGGGAVPKNDDIWIDVSYLSSSATPIATITNTTKATPLASNSACTSDTSTWGGSTTKFKMSVSVTPQLAGYIYVTVKAAKASSTFYIDPQPVLS